MTPAQDFLSRFFFACLGMIVFGIFGLLFLAGWASFWQSYCGTHFCNFQ